MAQEPFEAVNAQELIGKTLDGRYRVDAVLGQGGMGMVFKGIQTSVQRPVALKTLHPQLATAPTFFERFRRTVVIQRTEVPQLRHDQCIGRLARQPAARDAHLHDVDALGEHLDHIRLAVARLALHMAPGQP